MYQQHAANDRGQSNPAVVYAHQRPQQHQQRLSYSSDCDTVFCLQDEKHSLDVAFLVTRVMVFMCVDAQLKLSFEQHRLLTTLVTSLLSLTTSPAALASTRPSSPAATPATSPHRQSIGLFSAALQRQLVAEIIKLICHLCMDDQRQALQSSISEEQFQESVNPQYVAYCLRLSMALIS